MRLVFINRFYWPETPATGQLLTDLAEDLARNGHDVTVVTSHSRAAGLSTDETKNGVRVVRVPGTRFTKDGLAGKAVDWGSFYLRALGRLFSVVGRDTTVIAMTDPPLLGIGAWLVARMRGARVFHWVQDIYPELAIELTSHRWLKIVRPLRNASWRRGDACVTLGQDMARLLLDAHVSTEKIKIIPNWAPSGLTPQPANAEAPNALRAAWELTGKFVVAYSGNLGRVHDLDPVLSIAEAMSDEPEIAFVFIGHGAQREHLEAETKRRQLRNISFHPPQPRDQLAASLAVADLHLVTLRPGCEHLVFPSKLYGIAAAGRPVIFIGPSGCEVARMIREHGFGQTAERHQIPEIATAIRRMRSDGPSWERHAIAASRFAAGHDSASAAAAWHTLLDPMNACGRRPLAVTTLSA
jgi:colanic acid biosynthesis glycosyl transferase WcaI